MGMDKHAITKATLPSGHWYCETCGRKVRVSTGETLVHTSKVLNAAIAARYDAR